jgi:Zn-dependent protease
MHGDIRLGRLAGFPLSMSWTVGVIVWLITWGTSSAVLPDSAPGYAEGEYWAAGVVAAVLFFASLLAHELMHAVFARRAGVEVLGLTLWMFGGVATLRGEPRTARDDLRIAACGPLTSLALAAGFSLVTVGLVPLGTPALVLAVTAWLAVVNLVLGVFNLLPGAPLDGGRVLRAVLWQRSGDKLQATLRSTRAGQRTGVALAAVGLLEILAGADIGGLWFVFIGWFVLSSAKGEEQAARMLQAFSGLTVGDVMTPHPSVLLETLSTGEAAARLPWRAHEAYPTVDAAGRPTGLLRLGALAGVPTGSEGTLLVRDLAVPLTDANSACSREALTDAVTRTAPDGGGRFVVVDDGVLVGIVTPSDLNRVLRVQQVAGTQAQPPRVRRPPASAA